MDSPHIDAAALGFVPRSGGLHRDPYGVYRRLRAAAPVCYRPEYHDWLLSRYDDVKGVMQDARFQFSDPAETKLLDDLDWAAVQSLPPSAQKLGLRQVKAIDLESRFLDVRHPPDHPRLRRLMQSCLATTATVSLRPMVQGLTDELLDRVQPRGEMEVVNDFAFPLAFGIICRVLGCPQERASEVRAWTRALIDGIDLNAGREQHARKLWAMMAFAQYMHGILTSKAQQPASDFLSALVAAHAQQQLTADDLLANSIVMLFAGHETSQNALGLAIRTLLHHPQEWQQLCRQPEVIRTAVDELLRYDGPIQMRGHVALADVPIAGQLIKKGQRVRLLIGSANRDPEQFYHPERLDLRRQPNTHLEFFHGSHYCLGAPLARLELEVALSTLARRLPGLQLLEGSEAWLDTYFMRGLKHLRLRWEI
jgi:pimeloyl-[acyl-carrier protein] synthase